ncbi:MAG: heparin lyase I family protein [Candidatus Kapabacteria bacterium]|nr:heparin lyase I family protein [Candidatus Kapabacteria bacterium]
MQNTESHRQISTLLSPSTTVSSRIVYYFIIAMSLVVLSCGSSSVAPQLCPADVDVLSTITDVDGTQYKISVDGNVYKVVGNSCELFLRYFEPNFEANGYEHRGDSVFLRSDQGPFPTRNNFIEDFERYGAYPDLFIQSMVDTDRFWNTMILQGPQSPTIADYVALRACILRGTCTFRDNRIDIATDPLNPLNKVMKFTAVAPSASMVTSKSSIESTIAYFKKGSELWYEARYLFTGELPYSIADFECQWFDQSPGPRIVISNGALAIENKFGNKLKFRQSSAVPIPIGAWVTIKVHFVFDDQMGRVELWQDGAKILDVNAPTLPLVNAIQTNIEVGISATSNACVLYVDNVRLQDRPF